MFKPTSQILAIAFLFIGIPSTMGGDPKTEPSDTGVKQAANRDLSDESLLALLKQQVNRDTLLSQIDSLVSQLGDNDFKKRETASQLLVRAGKPALPSLEKATKSDDAEVRRRAATCIEKIQDPPKELTQLELVEALLQRRPAGLTAALVEFLPAAKDSAAEEAIYFGLAAPLEQGEKPGAALIATLEDGSSSRRALGALLIARFGNKDQKESTRKLLEDADATVRLRTAQGFLGANDKVGIPALIALLEGSRLEIAWQAEDLLHYAAGEDSPAVVLGKGTEGERAKCRAAWEGWWKEKGAKLDLTAAQQSNRRPGLVLALEEPTVSWEPQFKADPTLTEAENARRWGGRIWLCGCDGQPRYEPYTLDQVLTMFDHEQIDRRTFGTGECLFTLKVLSKNRIEWGNERQKSGWHWALRLGNGNRLISDAGLAPFAISRLVETDTAGRTVWEAAFEHVTDGILV